MTKSDGWASSSASGRHQRMPDGDIQCRECVCSAYHDGAKETVPREARAEVRRSDVSKSELTLPCLTLISGEEILCSGKYRCHRIKGKTSLSLASFLRRLGRMSYQKILKIKID